MIELRNTLEMEAALRDNIPNTLKDLIAKRMQQLGEDVEGDLSSIVNFIIVQPGDHISVIDKAIGFSLLVNLVDGSRLGDPEFAPSFEWIQDHCDFFELVYILSDDGFGLVVLVQDDPGIEFDIHMLCLENAGRPY